LEADPSLIEVGVEARVILATPTTLIALLRAVAYGWRQEQLAANAQQVADLGAELHARLRVFVEHFAKVRNGLETAVDSYNKAVGSFETRVLVSARKLKELGAGSGDDLDTIDEIDKVPRAIQIPDESGK
jgi:DNA recombination protein RmuC